MERGAGGMSELSLEERNRHGFVKVAELSGEHIGKALWRDRSAGDFGWETILRVEHWAEGTRVITVTRKGEQRDYQLDPARSVDVTAHRVDVQP